MQILTTQVTASDRIPVSTQIADLEAEILEAEMKIGSMYLPHLVRPFYSARLQMAQNGLDAAIDALIELSREAESRLAVADREWQESTDGKRCDEALTQIARTVCVLKGITFPDGRLLK